MLARPRPLSSLGPVLAAALVFGLVARPGTAQVAAPPAEDTLTRLTREYEVQRAAIERPQLLAHAQRLAALRESLKNRREPAAAAVAAELASVQSKLTRAGTAAGPAGSGPAAPKQLAAPLTLEGGKARTSGGSSILGDDNSPVHFAGKDSAAEWTLPALPVGRYRLLWRVACDVGAGATVRMTLEGLPARTLQIQPTTSAGDTVVVNLGEFTLTTPPGSIKIEVLDLPGRPRKTGPSFSISKVVLIPPGVTVPGL